VLRFNSNCEKHSSSYPNSLPSKPQHKTPKTTHMSWFLLV